MWIDGAWRRSAPVYALDGLASGVPVAGPAAVTSAFTTAILHPGDVAAVAPSGDLLVELGR
jgi:hypothetical protein